jgi:hypothetical protein
MSDKDTIPRDGDLEPAGTSQYTLPSRRFAFDTFIITDKEGRQTFRLPASAKFCAFSSALGYVRIHEYTVTYLHEATDTKVHEFTLQVVSNGEVFECSSAECMSLVASQGSAHLIQWHPQTTWGVSAPTEE